MRHTHKFRAAAVPPLLFTLGGISLLTGHVTIAAWLYLIASLILLYRACTQPEPFISDEEYVQRAERAGAVFYLTGLGTWMASYKGCDLRQVPDFHEKAAAARHFLGVRLDGGRP